MDTSDLVGEEENNGFGGPLMYESRSAEVIESVLYEDFNSSETRQKLRRVKTKTLENIAGSPGPATVVFVW